MFRTHSLSLPPPWSRLASLRSIAGSSPREVFSLDRNIRCFARHEGWIRHSDDRHRTEIWRSAQNRQSNRQSEAMTRGGRRSTSFKPGVSGNPRGRPKHVVPKRLQAAPSGSIRVCLYIHHQARAPSASMVLSEPVRKPTRTRWAMACLRPRRDSLYSLGLRTGLFFACSSLKTN